MASGTPYLAGIDPYRTRIVRIEPSRAGIDPYRTRIVRIEPSRAGIEPSRCFHIRGWSHCLGGWVERRCHHVLAKKGLVAKAQTGLITQS